MFKLLKNKKIDDFQYFSDRLHLYWTINPESVCSLFPLHTQLQVAILFGLKGELCFELKMKLRKNMVFTQKWPVCETCTIKVNRTSIES